MTAWLIALVVATTQVTGVVRATDGTPVAGASIRSIQPSAAVVVTDATGSFTLPVALPALVDVTAPGFAPRRVFVATAPAAITLSAVTVSESLVVTGAAGDAGTWRDPLNGQTTLTSADVEAVPGVTLDESLGVLSGFSLFRRSSSRYANPTTHGVTMRGLSASGASRGLVLFDGIPLSDGFGGWVTWTRLPAQSFTRVEVERGLHGDEFGSDAVGGVIRVITPPVGRDARRDAAVLAEIGSSGVGVVDGSGAYQDDRFSLFGAASWFRTDGHIPVEPDARGSVDQPTDADWFSGLGRLGFAGDARRLSVTAWGGRDDRGNGTTLQRNTMSGGTVAASYDTAFDATTFAARVSFSPNSFEQSFTAVADDRNSEFLTNRQTIDTSVTRAIVELGHAAGDSFVMVRGAVNRADADFAQVRSTSSSLDTVRDDGEALSVQAGFAPTRRFAGRLTLTGGFRADWRAAPGDDDGRDTAVVGQAGASWRVSDRVSVRGLAATSHRWPTLNELIRGFRVGNVVTNANADLEPERSRSVEGAVVYDEGRVMVSAGAFHTRVNGAIANVTLSTDGLIVRERQNAGQVRSTGLELDVEVRQLSRYRARGSLTVIGSTFADADAAGITGNRVPQVPRVSGSVAADVLLPHDMTATLVWRSSSAQFDDDRNVFELAASNQVDVRVGGDAGDFGWRVSVENLFDQRIEVGRTPLVTLAPGISIRAGLSWRY